MNQLLAIMLTGVLGAVAGITVFWVAGTFIEGNFLPAALGFAALSITDVAIFALLYRRQKKIIERKKEGDESTPPSE